MASPSPHAKGSAGERLRTHPAFVLTAALDGRPYVAKETEPYTQFWLSERERRLLALFGGRQGSTVDQAVQAHCRWSGASDVARETKLLARCVAEMRQAGVLMAADEDTSRYSQRIVRDYVKHRPIPPEVATLITARGGIGADTRVLDLAGGPGCLALALARQSNRVAMMDLSRGFVAAARQRARAAGVPLQTLHDSCNRLVYRDEAYDVVTVSQALHWLDDVMVCRGLCRVLAPGGSFFVVHSAIELADAHPLAFLLGHDSVLGAKPRNTFVAEVQPLQRRLALLFQALDAPEVQRIDPTQQWTGAAQAIAGAGVQLFRQRRPFGVGYARGFLTPQHLARLGADSGAGARAFWADLQARCAAAAPEQWLGTHHWAVLHFQRGATGARVPGGGEALAIPYDGPAE